jgi:hypothetical protein
MLSHVVSVLSAVAEVGLFFAAAGVLVLGVLGLK